MIERYSAIGGVLEYVFLDVAAEALVSDVAHDPSSCFAGKS